MARFVRGDVVVVPFPFSDLTLAKRRPALVAAELDGDDLILCQITSQGIRDRYAAALADVKSAIKFHMETFGEEALEESVEETSIADTTVAL